MESAPLGEALPHALHYTQPLMLGSVAEADYCPFYHIQITNHGCTDTSATTFPISNVNFERETFGARSRCLDSTLNGNVKAYDGVYRAEPERFSTPKPRCYEIHCMSLSYEVWISDLRGGKVKLGICTSAGHALTGLGLQGQVICAAPEELCGLKRATHLGLASNFPAEVTAGLASKVGSIQPVAEAELQAVSRVATRSVGASAVDIAGAMSAVLGTVAVATVAGAAAIVAVRCRLVDQRFHGEEQGWSPVPQGGSCRALDMLEVTSRLDDACDA